jgi:hypothetical protein
MIFSCFFRAMLGFWSSLGSSRWSFVVGRSQMKLQKKITVLMVCLILPYMCAVLFLVRYMLAHPGPLPRWIAILMLCLLITTCALGGVAILRVTRKHLAAETSEEGDRRGTRAIKTLKAGLVIYGLILLNGIALVVRHKIAWNYGVPGLVVDLLLIILFWFSLSRLKTSSTTDPGGTRHQQ